MLLLLFREWMKDRMSEGLVQIYSGARHGKSAAAYGRAIQEACAGKNVVIISFLKGTLQGDILKRLEPEIKFFRFEKSEEDFDHLSLESQTEEIRNMKNGLNFARKVLTTGECNLLILDEVLGLLDNDIISIEDLKRIVDAKADDVGIIMTGIHLSDEVCELADEISVIEPLNY